MSVLERETPLAADGEAVGRLRAAFSEAGYRQDRLESELGLSEPLKPETAELPYYLLALERAGRLGTLVRLFQLGLAIEEAEVAAALAPASLVRLEALGLLEREGARVRSPVAVTPVLHLLLASDWEPAASPPARPDHVLGASSPSRILTSLGVRLPVESALDIGTGSGLQALLAAGHADRVVATDVNPRALRFTELNAALNGIENVETREGSMFEPVEGERFDLISANPPYIVSPDSEFVFRDSGLPGDSFCEALVRALPGHLNEGGIAHMLASWAYRADEDRLARPREWVAGGGCDALLFHHGSSTPLEYANGENRMHWRDPSAYREALARWVAYFRSLGIDRIGWGAIMLKRRSGGGRVTALDVSLTAVGPAGHHVGRLFEAQRHLAQLDGDALLDARLQLVDDSRLDQSIAFRQGEGVIERAVVRLDGGLRLQVELDPQLPKVLALIDAGQPVGEVVAEAVRELSGPGADPERIASAALGAVRVLVQAGFLVPAGSNPR